jgi:hypothetical protein
MCTKDTSLTISLIWMRQVCFTETQHSTFYNKVEVQEGPATTCARRPTKLGPEILREITILQAYYWISAAWKEVDSDTIVKCFAKCGFTPECVSV